MVLETKTEGQENRAYLLTKYTTSDPQLKTKIKNEEPKSLKLDPTPIQVHRPRTIEELRKLPENITHLDCAVLHELLTDKNIAKELERFKDCLEDLNLTGCSSITNFDFLVSKRFNKIAILNLAQCNNLTNINILKDLLQLRILDLYRCENIKKDGIKILLEESKSLKEIKLAECGVSAKYIDEIALRFPKLGIIGKDGISVSCSSVLEKMAEQKAIAEAIAEEKKAIKAEQYANKKSQQEKSGDITLYKAIQDGDVAQVKELSFGVDVDTQIGGGKTLLDFAKERGNQTIIYLLEIRSKNAVEEKSVDGDEMKRVQLRDQKPDKDKIFDSLNSGVNDAQADLLFSKLFPKGTDFNAKDKDGDTPLHSSLKILDGGVDKEIQEVAIKLITSLLEAGADPNIKNKEGKSFIDLALENLPIKEKPLVVGMKQEQEVVMSYPSPSPSVVMSYPSPSPSPEPVSADPLRKVELERLN